MNICTSDKDEAELIRWIQSFASTDDARPVLEGLFIDGKNTVAADGFRMGVIRTPEILKQFDGKIVVLSEKMKVNRDVEVTIVEGTYPDYKSIFPRGLPRFAYSSNARLLSDIIRPRTRKGPDYTNKVNYKFWSPTAAIQIEFEDRKAIMMPMYTGDVAVDDPPIKHAWLVRLISVLGHAAEGDDPKRSIEALIKKLERIRDGSALTEI